MFKLSGFGDEISSKLEEQLDLLESEGIKYLELRAVNEKNVMDLNDAEIKNIKDVLQRRHFGISAIGSPIGKIGIQDDFVEHLKKFERAVYLAKFFSAKYIRVFSYYIPEKESPEKFRDEVLRRMKEKAKIAEKENVVLVNENEHALYGQMPEECKDVIESVNSPNLKCLFDPGNFAIEGVKPYTRAFLLLKNHIEYLHIKDAKYTPGKLSISLPGEGEAQIREVLAGLKEMNFDGFLSLEPHLSVAEKSSGFSGPELFRKAIKALKKILAEVETEE